jgi:hypothetical protein
VLDKPELPYATTSKGKGKIKGLSAGDRKIIGDTNAEAPPVTMLPLLPSITPNSAEALYMLQIVTKTER